MIIIEHNNDNPQRLPLPKNYSKVQKHSAMTSVLALLENKTTKKTTMVIVFIVKVTFKVYIVCHLHPGSCHRHSTWDETTVVIRMPYCTLLPVSS